MRQSGSILFVYLVVIIYASVFIDYGDARSNAIRDIHHRSMNRFSQGKRGRARDPVVITNIEQEIKEDESKIELADSTNANSNDKLAITMEGDGSPGMSKTSWLELEGVPPTRVSVKLHSDLTLECQAVGSPAPNLYWLKNGKPIEPALSHTSEEYLNSVDSSRFLGSKGGDKGFVMAKTKSKLPLLCIRPEDEAEYTCVAENDGHQVVASTTVVIEEDDPSGEVRPECEHKLSMYFSGRKGKKTGIPAYVLSAETLHMESIGNDVLLPCHGAGKPRPKISWIDADGHRIVSGKKFQVHSNGNLLIRNLRWKDMGEYSCQVENSHGSDIASVFVYPLMTENA